MRVIVIGNARQRRDLTDVIEDSAPQVVGEFETVAEARRSGIAADAIVIPARVGAANDDPAPEALTPREVQVLELVAEGLPNKTIADRLKISDQTVKFHIASISGKLGAANRTDAVRRAVHRGLITL
ncbi:MAG TPA: response regulator transcription factor [Vicinamibacterales bacterium]|nr:response regulator transcription factor [Vicinamibacterales bacterium]